MNFLIIIHSGNTEDIELLKPQMVSGDVIAIEDLGKNPCRTIHRALIYTKAKQCNKVLMLGTNTKVCPGLLDYIRGFRGKHRAMVVGVSSRVSMANHRVGSKPVNQIYKSDVLVFNKDIYRGRLGDMSAHLDYQTILQIILQPIREEIPVAMPIPQYYFNIPESFDDYPFIEITPYSKTLMVYIPYVRDPSLVIYQSMNKVTCFEDICVNFELEDVCYDP